VILALALLLQAAPATAGAPEPAWQGLGVHGGIDTAYDPASVRRENGRVRVRIRGVTRAAGADGIRTVTGTNEIDCAAGTATPLDAKGYDAAGRLMLNAIVPVADRHAEPIRPDSPNAAVRARVCAAQAR
jgi:hypothetical protein